MKLLVVGGGGREHALVWALSKSPKIDKLYCAPGNGGIAALAECVPIKATDIGGMVDFVKREAIDFVLVAPDDPLALGMVDAIEQAGILAFGPSAAAAVIESSKAFSKNLMQAYDIPTADFAVFYDMEKAFEYIVEKGAPIVVKADGLALGKGVVVAQTVDEAQAAVKSMMEERLFGDAGSRVVIEECLSGPEVTVLCFTDGNTIVPMPSSQDHKRAFDNDEGPNTGGMGAFSPSRYYTDEIAKQCMETIFLPTMNAMNQEGRTFKGVIYFGLMLTQDGPKVIEYNARFGDPECQTLLPLLETDLFEILQAVVEQRLSDMDIRFSTEASCCLVLASGGYPGKYETGKEITGLDDASGALVFHAGTKLEDGKVKTSGGRVLGVTAAAQSIDDAIKKAYKSASKIHFDNMHFRTDIGVK